MKNLRIFKKLCGDDGLGSVVLATTMWGNLPERSLGEMREKELIENKEFWGGMMGKGSRVFRHDNGLDSAKVIVDHLVKKKRPVVLEIQKQLVDQGMTLEETAAGMALYQEIQHHVTKLSDTIKELQKELASSRDKDDREEIELQLKEMAQKMRERERDQRRLQESWEQMMEEDRKRRDAAEMERERLMTEKHALEIERVMMRHQSELEAKNLRLEDQQRRLREKDSKCCVM
jgi:DNA repair exonuclease SbcCD ATPase subunit